MLQESRISKIFNDIALLLIMFSLIFYLRCIFRIHRETLISITFAAGILCTVVLVYIVAALSRQIKTDTASITFLLLTSLIMLLIWNYYVQARPVSDYRVLWEGAGQIVDGTFHERALRKDDYFCMFNYQIGYAFYLSILFRLFHGSLAAAKIVIIIVIALTNIIIYKTLRLYTGIRTSLCGATLFMCYPFIFMGSGILNNSHEAMLFEALAVYMYLKYADNLNFNRWYVWIITGLFLYLAVFMRPTAIVIVIAIFILSILKALLYRDKAYILIAVITITAYLIINSAVNNIFIASGLAPYGLNTNNLWFKLSLGLTGNGITNQYTTSAEYTNLYYDLKFYGFNYDAYKAAAQNYINTILRTKTFDIIKFVYRKMVYFSGSFDNQFGYIGIDFARRYPVMINILNISGICIYFLSVLFSGIRCCTRKILRLNEIALPALIFGGYFITYILFETQTRYRYEQYFQ